MHILCVAVVRAHAYANWTHYSVLDTFSFCVARGKLKSAEYKQWFIPKESVEVMSKVNHDGDFFNEILGVDKHSFCRSHSAFRARRNSSKANDSGDRKSVV